MKILGYCTKIYYTIALAIESTRFLWQSLLVFDHFFLNQVLDKMNFFFFYKESAIAMQYYDFVILPISIISICFFNMIVYLYHYFLLLPNVLERYRLKASIFIKGYFPYIIGISFISALNLILEYVYRFSVDREFFHALSSYEVFYFATIVMKVGAYNLALYLLGTYASYMLVAFIIIRKLYKKVL